MAILFLTPYIWTNGEGIGMQSVAKTIDYFSKKDKLYILLPTNIPEKWKQNKLYNRNSFLVYLKMPRWIATTRFDENISAFHVFLNNRPLWFVRIMVKIYEFLFIFGSMRAASSLNKDGVKFSFVYGASPPGIIASFLIGQRLGIKSIGRLFGNPRVKPKIFDLGNLWRITHSLAFVVPTKLLICTNDGTQGDLVNNVFKKFFSWKKHQTFWLPRNGYSIKSIDKTIVKPKSPIVFISISRHENIKRIDLGLKIFTKLLRSYSHRFRLVYNILNDGPETEELKKLVRDLKIENYCHFKGPVSWNQLEGELRKAHFFLTFMNKSNVGNVLFEAMANKCTIIAHDTGGTRNVIKNQENGILISNRSEQEIIDNSVSELGLLIKNPQLSANLGENAQKWVLENLRPWEERLKEEYELITKL